MPIHDYHMTISIHKPTAEQLHSVAKKSVKEKQEKCKLTEDNEPMKVIQAVKLYNIY